MSSGFHCEPTSLHPWLSWTEPWLLPGDPTFTGAVGHVYLGSSGFCVLCDHDISTHHRAASSPREMPDPVPTSAVASTKCSLPLPLCSSSQVTSGPHSSLQTPAPSSPQGPSTDSTLQPRSTLRPRHHPDLCQPDPLAATTPSTLQQCPSLH